MNSKGLWEMAVWKLDFAEAYYAFHFTNYAMLQCSKCLPIVLTIMLKRLP